MSKWSSWISKPLDEFDRATFGALENVYHRLDPEQQHTVDVELAERALVRHQRRYELASDIQLQNIAPNSLNYISADDIDPHTVWTIGDTFFDKHTSEMKCWDGVKWVIMRVI